MNNSGPPRVDLRPYPAYKDSGITWLGKVPEHWEIRPLRCSFRVLNGATPATGDPENWNGEIVWITPDDLGHLPGRDIHISDRRISAKGYLSCGTSIAPPNSIVLSTRAPIGYLGITRVSACVNQGCRLLVPNRDELPEYWYYELLTGRSELDSIGRGSTFTELSRSDLLAFHVARPTPAEQAAIVRYLDHMDRQIRRYIRTKQKLIKLLEEQKQTIIHRTVTRGLDPNIRLKHSSIESLGDVPEHWEVRPAKHFYREVDDRSATGEEELLSVSHITGVTPRSQKNITMFMASSYVGHKVCRPGDLVINTMWAWMAALGVARQTGIVSPSYGVYRPFRASTLLEGYADLLLRTKPYVREYICRSTGIRPSRLRLYPEQFLRIRLALPPADEQKVILEKITIETTQTKRAIADANSEIALLREYRTRLIADVVTGKLDVRELAAGLPGEVEEPELLDDTGETAEMDESMETDEPNSESEDAST